mmetsp:Transcript_30836/g.56109  ORF Transcript_30836/g.56109 Transcript_30836/m.56109 type:complete len:223 (+) Transcript_30836:51-719(+)
MVQQALIVSSNNLSSHPRHFNKLKSRDVRVRSTCENACAVGRYFERVKGFHGPIKAGLTSATLSAAGDLLAQGLCYKIAEKRKQKPQPYDPSRTLRMFGYGLLWYGPFQFYWYNLLEFLMPIKTTSTFLTKILLNQFVLAPLTLSTVFAYTLYLTGKAHEIRNKINRDLVPTMINGWKFWIPAASLNFYAIPIQHQVMYMSVCGLFWTAYLSYASSLPAKEK